MKKIVSLLLTALMAFSAMTVGAFSASAAEDDQIPVVFEAGSYIYFDNTNTKWDEVYFYSWAYGYFGDFVPMDKVEGKDNLYSVVVPQDIPEYYVDEKGLNQATECFLFTSQPNWSGKQTQNMPVELGMNTYTPIVNSLGNVTRVNLSSTEPAKPTSTVVLATPYSKKFTKTIDVTVYAFNVPEGATATYQINDAAPVAFTDPETFTLSETSTVKVAVGEISKTYTYTEVSDAVINVTAVYEDLETPYTGNIYAYTFGGDRVGAAFNLMTKNEDGTYTYSINGSAQVIFTDTDNWDTAKKFIIYEGSTELPDQEPLVSAGTTVNYTLVYPGSPAE